MSSCRQQRGLALVEAMVAMFLLAFGVLALMAAQLQSVSASQEAENQTIAAQAAQNLMEGMLSNPSITTASDSLTMVKSYAAYADMSKAQAASGELTKAGLAGDQLAAFRVELSQMKNATNINGRVCSYANGACQNGNAAPYAIEVTWNMKTNSNDASTASNGGLTTYRYILPVQD